MSEENDKTEIGGYKPPDFKNEIRLQLSRNESIPVIGNIDSVAAEILDPEIVRRYPDRSHLRKLIGDFTSVAADRIVITAGGDDAIDRVLKVLLGNDQKEVVAHTPSFEMIEIYAAQYGASLRQTKWLEGPFPEQAFSELIGPQTAVGIVVTPNNPTGGVLSTSEIVRLANTAQASGAYLMVDLAYVEFADDDPTPVLAELGNVVMIRTFSKAWGLAGLRTGYLIAPDKKFANQVRSRPGPYPVSGTSIAVASCALERYQAQMLANVQTVRQIREMLSELITDCGGTPLPSEGNFVLAGFQDSGSIWRKLCEEGIGVRKFPGNKELENMLRITCPATTSEFLDLAACMCRVTGVDVEPHKSAACSIAGSRREIKGTGSQINTATRTASSSRKTKETGIEIELNLDGSGKTEIETGIGFLDHMLTALAFHSGIDLKLKCDGDLHVDDHHTAEDCALALGSAIDSALGRRTGIRRFGFAYAPLDEALARTVIDLSGRPWPEIHLDLKREMIGEWACENITHFFQSLAMALKCSLHVDVLRGDNDHHKAEAAFKSLAKSLGQALMQTEGDVPSTKGVL